MATLRVPACGKINLALYVLGRRDDGFHAIATLMQAIDLSDTLELTQIPEGLHATCSDPDLPVDERNLVTRAVRILEREAGRTLPLRIHLDKRLPIGAGVGGGSSDAAATLWAVNELFGLGRTVADLQALGAELGSDVPFFLTSGQALAEGRGEVLTELDLPSEYDVLLAFPGIHIGSGWAYSRAKLSLTNPLSDCRFRRYRTLEEFWGAIGSLDNDLAAGITATYPVVARGIEAMRSLGARHAGMTGSGSAVFGLFEPSLPVKADTYHWPLSDAWAVFRARPRKTPGKPLPSFGWVTSGG